MNLNKVKNLTHYKIVLDIIRPKRHIFVFIVILGIINGFFSGFSILALFPVILSLLSGQQPQEGNIFNNLFHAIHAIPVQDPIFASCIFLFLICTLSLLSYLALEFFTALGVSEIGYYLKDRIFRVYSQKDYQFFVNTKHGQLFYDLFSAPQRTSVLINMVADFFSTLFNFVFLVILLFLISVKFTVLIIIFLSFFFLVFNIIAHKTSLRLGQQRKIMFTHQQVIANEFINGIKQIMIYLSKEKWIQEFDKVNKELKEIMMKYMMFLAIPKSVIEFSFFLFAIFICLFFRNKNITAAELSSMAVYVAALTRLVPYATQLGGVAMKMMEIMPDAQGVQKYLLEKHEDVEMATQELKQLQDKIYFDQLSFSYNDRSFKIIDLNLTIERGKTTALVGLSGSGKTTIVNLLLKLLKPTSGKILVDGVDLSDIMTKSWLKSIGFVSQDMFIFNSTIKENILFGESCYTIKDVIEAAKIAFADDFICELKEGYETNVGEKGMKLSIGQQQRIAIARAIIRNPQIFIFDEPTSALDNISESKIQAALSAISKDRTVITIAHRLSTIKKADKIIVVKGGHKCEEGTHDELVALRGEYWHLYNKAL